MSEAPILTARGLTRRFGALHVLRGLDLEVGPGQVLVVLGENGSGKSTLLRLLAGLTRPSAGAVEIEGRPVTASDPEVRRLFGLVAHQSTLYDDLTVRENLVFGARLHGLPDPAAAAERAMESTDIAHRSEDRAGRLSRGMQQRAAIARAFIHRPRLMFLDEPFTALDAISAQDIKAWVGRRIREGASAVVVTHQLAEVWDLATHVGRDRARALGHPGPAGARAGSVPPEVPGGDPCLSICGVALAIAAKDLQLEFRTKTALLSALMFAALVLLIFNFARDPTAVSTTDLAPSVLWVTFAFAAVVTLNRAFNVERENAAFDGLRLAPVPRSALYLGKLAANLVFVGVVQTVTLPLFVLFFNVDLSQSWPGIVAVSILATVGFVAVGTVFSAMVVRTRFAELMLPVLLLPFMVPPLIGATQATSRFLAGPSVERAHRMA